MGVVVSPEAAGGHTERWSSVLSREDRSALRRVKV